MSNAQAEYEKRFHDTVERRANALAALEAATASIPRLKADAAQARADMSRLRADARAAGVKLPKLAQTSAANDAPAASETEDDDAAE